MLTEAVIRKIAPRARQDYIAALLDGADVLQRHSITTPVRMAQFLANVCAETGGLTIIRENMNYSAARIKAVWPNRPEAVKFAGNPQGLASCVYGGRMGNRPGSDDGWNFRGCGAMQTTGRENFEKVGKILGLDLGNHPELLEDPKNSLIAAAHEFAPLVNYCDRGEAGFRAVCNGINRGNPTSRLDPIGWSERQIALKACVDALGASVAAGDDLDHGDHGALVIAFQQRLAALGYPIGRPDGIYGSRTRAAVLAFQAENGLVTDGKIGPQTRQALNSDAAKPMPIGERATETKDDLKAAGSTTLQATDAVKAAAKGLGSVASISVVADQAGFLDRGKALLDEMTQYRGVVSGLSEVLIWATGHWFYFVPLVAYFGWKWAKTIEVQRVIKHQLGLDASL